MANREHFVPLDDYMGIHFKNKSLRPVVYEISWYKYIRTIILTFDPEVQGHIIFQLLIMFGYMSKSPSYDKQLARYYDLSAFAL